MHTYAMADEAGKILQVINGPYRYVKCSVAVMDNTHYANEADEIVEKQTLVVSVRTDDLTITLSGVPSGMTVKTNGMEAISDDEPLEIEYDLPGPYTVSLSGLVEYLDDEIEVTVGED